jgi:hypothetical protein
MTTLLIALRSLFAFFGANSLSMDLGSTMDPDGLQGDLGSTMDPNG